MRPSALASRKLVLACTVLGLWGASTGHALAAPGDLDTAFGQGGKAIVDLGGYDSARALALQPDGKILLGGWSDVNGTDFAVARLLNPQGTLDPSYGGGTGKSRIDFGTSSIDAGEDLLLQPDGRIVVVGSSTANGTYNFAAVRLLNPAGTPDPSFGIAGKSLADLGGAEDFGRAAALQPDGKIVMAGTRSAGGSNVFAIVKLQQNGYFDPGYGSGTGWSTASMGTSDEGNDVVLRPDGTIVVAGTSTQGGVSDFALAHITNEQGSFTPQFADFSSGDSGNAIALQPDGKILVAGQVNAPGNSDFGVARFLPTGQLDSTFGVGGKSVTSFGATDTALAMALYPDGKIVVVGRYSGEQSDFAVMRLQPNGTLDTTFDGDGKVLIDFGGIVESATDVALQPDGKVVVAGPTGTPVSSNFAVARLQGFPEGAGGPGGPGGGGGSGSGTTPKCGGKRATIIGTSARDNLKGTRRADVIVGLGGRDKLSGLGGNDRICGGSGADRISGGNGKDRLYGNAGNDRLSGGAGKDRLSGGSGRDRLKGGSGRDILSGGSGKDRCSGKDRKRSC